MQPDFYRYARVGASANCTGSGSKISRKKNDPLPVYCPRCGRDLKPRYAAVAGKVTTYTLPMHSDEIR